MPDFELRISTPADLAGAKETEAHLQSLIARAKHFGVATHELEEQMDAVQKQIAGATPAAVNGYKKIKKSVEGATLSHRELREAIGAVGRQFGGLPDVGLWITPQLAGLAALTAAWSQLADFVGKTMDRLVQAVDLSQEIEDRFTNAVPNALRDSANAEKLYQEQLAQTARAVDKVGESLRQQNDISKENLSTTESKTDALERQAEAMIKIAHASGGLTDDQASLMTEEAERQAKARKNAAEVAEKHGEAARGYAAATNYGTEAQSAAATVAKDQDRLTTVNAAIENQTGTVADTAAALKDAAKDVNDARKAFLLAQGEAAGTTGVPGLSALAQKNLEDKTGALGAAEETLRQAKANAKAAADHAKVLEADKAELEQDIASAKELYKSRIELAQKTRDAAEEMDRQAKSMAAKFAEDAAIDLQTSRINRAAATPQGRAGFSMGRPQLATEVATVTQQASELFGNINLEQSLHQPIPPDQVAKLVDLMNRMLGIMANPNAGSGILNKIGALEHQIEQLEMRLGTQR